MLPEATEPPGIALIEVALAPLPPPLGADQHEARVAEAPMAETVTLPDPPTPVPPPIPAPIPPAIRSLPPTARPAPRPATSTTSRNQPAPAEIASAGIADPSIVAAWQAALSAWIERNRRYPPAARFRQEEGVVQVRFELDPAGKVLRAEVQQASGSATLDAAALTLLNGATLPAPPPDLEPARRVVSLAIRYRLE